MSVDCPIKGPLWSILFIELIVLNNLGKSGNEAIKYYYKIIIMPVNKGIYHWTIQRNTYLSH